MYHDVFFFQINFHFTPEVQALNLTSEIYLKELIMVSSSSPDPLLGFSFGPPETRLYSFAFPLVCSALHSPAFSAFPAYLLQESVCVPDDLNTCDALSPVGSSCWIWS